MKDNPGLFDFINSVSHTKENYSELENFDKLYNCFMVNRFISSSIDTVFFANLCSKLSNVPDKAKYLFLLHGIPKKKRYFKYDKKQKTEKQIKNIVEYYQVSSTRAVEILELLTKDQIKEIEKIYLNRIER